jgi:hypothetical protein
LRASGSTSRDETRMTVPAAVASGAGIRFEVQTPPLPSALPRMDVAAFVGFAASGPVDVPVPVESIAEYEEVFGGDLRIGSDPTTNRTVYAELAPCVRQFFRAGGRRCWIVRAAQGAVPNRFPIPGLLAFTGHQITAAHLVARSPGSWSDGLQLNASSRMRRLQATRLDGTNPPRIRVAPVAPGDLVRLSVTRGRDLVAFVPIQPHGRAFDPQRQHRDSAAAAATIDLRAGVSTWYWRVTRRSAGLGVSVPGGHACDAEVLATSAAGDATPLPMPGARCRWQGQTFILECEAPAPAPIVSGSWIRVRADGVMLYGLVSQVLERRRDTGSGAPRIHVDVSHVWRTVTPDEAIPDLLHAGAVGLRADVVTINLWVRSPADASSAAELGLAEFHASYLADLPDDIALHDADRHAGTDEAQDVGTLPPLHRAPHLPLASPYPSRRGVGGALMRPEGFLPLGLAALPVDDWFQSAVPRPEPVLDRDGIAVFDPGVFVQDELADAGSTTLLEQAFRTQYLDVVGPVPNRLRGMHALFGVDEPSMIAVPDAVHALAAHRLPAPEDLAAPRGLKAQVAADGNGAELTWTAPAGAKGYRVERATDPRFTTTVVEVPADPGDAAAPYRQDGDIPSDATPVRYFYRVGARGVAGRIGPWSATVWLTLPRRDFAACADDQPPAPSLTLDDQGDTDHLHWTQPASGVADYVLEASADPSFAVGTILYQGAARRFSIWDATTQLLGLRQSGRLRENAGIHDLYFRVTATIDGREAPWSRTVHRRGLAPDSPRAHSMAAQESADRADLVRIHAALLRLCAARGDAHAILSLPAAWRVADANTHLQGLIEALGRKTEDDGLTDRILSFGALWHPWPVIREATGTGLEGIRARAPDGLIAGMIAARTIDGGPWLAPANQPFPDVLLLTPVFAAVELDALSSRLNALRESPRGFTTLSAVTLAGEQVPAVHELGVRRLLILIRRLVLREGATFVFLPHDDYLRRLVQRAFERVLGDLFTRGALAGTRPEDAFLVIADETVNPPDSVAQGRMVVELWIAPSLPLRFLTVRLVQFGGQLLTVEEAA